MKIATTCWTPEEYGNFIDCAILVLEQRTRDRILSLAAEVKERRGTEREVCEVAFGFYDFKGYATHAYEDEFLPNFVDVTDQFEVLPDDFDLNEFAFPGESTNQSQLVVTDANWYLRWVDDGDAVVETVYFPFTLLECVV